MIQYLPWSDKTYNVCSEAHKNGRLPTIDIELTAKCSAASCIYCDSMPTVCANPNIEELALEPTIDLFKQALDIGLKWVYTCGLGEPFEDKRFFVLLDYFREHDVKLSIFTNGLFINDISIAKLLKDSGVNIILKMDTFNAERFDQILGGKKGRAKMIYLAINYLLEVGYTEIGDEGYTDLAFSIVPTQLTKETIPEVVDYCLRHNIFPSVGELEKAGNVVRHSLFESLGLTKECLDRVRQKSELAQLGYMRPVCPAILSGLHIDNQGNCIVDEITGFSCKWFLLTDPRPKIIGNIAHESIIELQSRVAEYRNKCWRENRQKIDEYEKIDYIFGGCGGNPSEIIKLYKEMSGFV